MEHMQGKHSTQLYYHLAPILFVFKIYYSFSHMLTVRVMFMVLMYAVILPYTFQSAQVSSQMSPGCFQFPSLFSAAYYPPYMFSNSGLKVCYYLI